MTSPTYNYTLPSIDLDTATRNELVSHVEVLRFKLEEILPSDLQIQILCKTLEITKQEALILACLSNGHIWTNERLLGIASRWKDGIEPQLIRVVICKLRKKITSNVQIKNCFGVGYQITEGLEIIQKAMEGIKCTP